MSGWLPPARPRTLRKLARALSRAWRPRSGRALSVKPGATDGGGDAPFYRFEEASYYAVTGLPEVAAPPKPMVAYVSDAPVTNGIYIVDERADGMKLQSAVTTAVAKGANASLTRLGGGARGRKRAESLYADWLESVTVHGWGTARSWLSLVVVYYLSSSISY